MPTNRRARKRARRGTLTRAQFAALVNRWDFFNALQDLDVPAAWATVSTTIVAAHVAEFPGTRPRRWWDHEAPELRRRVGGVGTHHGPDSWYGVPSVWAGMDPEDPPRFEAQATYLKRLGLFLPGEREQLGPEDFEPDEGPGPELDRGQREALVEKLQGTKAA